MPRRKRQKSQREAFEEAIEAEPDDLGHYSGFADWLSEQDDPADRARGDFIAVQQALEAPSRPALERRSLRRREKRLLEKYQRQWLGGLAPFLPAGGAEPGERPGLRPRLGPG